MVKRVVPMRHALTFLLAANVGISHAAAQAPLSSADRVLQEGLAGTWFAESKYTDRWDGTSYDNEIGKTITCYRCCAEEHQLNARLIVSPKRGPNGGLLAGKSIVVRQSLGAARVNLAGSDMSVRHARILEQAEARGRVTLICPPNPSTAARKSEYDIIISASGSEPERVIKYFAIEDKVVEYTMNVISSNAFERVSSTGQKRLFRKLE